MQSHKRIVLIRGTWATLDLFSREMEKYFAERGTEIFILDTNDLIMSLGGLYEFVKKPVDAVLTFNNVGLNMELEQGKRLWDQLAIPCIDILVDHPVCYLQELQMAPERTTVVCVDRNHVSFVKRFFPNIRETYFMPHGGTMCGSEQIPWRDRPIEVLYAGGLPRKVASSYIPENLDEICGFRTDELCDEVLTELITDTDCTFEAAMEHYFVKRQVELEDEQLLQYIRMFRFLDVYAFSYYREKSVRLLVQNGIPVTLYGPGWENCDWITNPNVNYHTQVSPEEILSLMGKAKIVLNSMPNFKDGSHERIFNGMLAGAAVVTDTSRYMEKEMQGQEFVWRYELKNQNELPGMVEDILRYPKMIDRVTERAYGVAVEHHTWKKRVQQIESYIEQT